MGRLPADFLRLLSLQTSCIIQCIRWPVCGNLAALCYILFSIILFAAVFGCFTGSNNSCQLPHKESGFILLWYCKTHSSKGLDWECATFSQLEPNCSAYIIINTASCSSKAQLQWHQFVAASDLHQGKMMPGLWLWSLF